MLFYIMFLFGLVFYIVPTTKLIVKEFFLTVDYWTTEGIKCLKDPKLINDKLISSCFAVGLFLNWV